MKNRQFALLLFISITGLMIVFSACRKINEATDLGDDLIPVVDNIHTFDTTITVETYNGIFDPLLDSTRFNELSTYFLGKISNDPIFGTTDAKLFFELKPNFYKYSFENKSDSLHIDSVVLVLEYNSTYGDTNAAQTVNVYEVDQATNFKYDSNYLITNNTFTYSNLLGSKTFFPRDLDDTTAAPQDTTNNVLRIRLDPNFGHRLLNYDSSATGAYLSDSAFQTKFNGFALEATAGNAIIAYNLSGAKTKLAIYYRYDKNNVLNADTTFKYFNFTLFSASANLVTRTHPTTITSSASNPSQDDIVYIQNTPGTYATIKIPGLAALSNRVVHRAELIMEQVYDPSDDIFTVPTSLMLDAWDPTISKYRTIPYDMQPDGQGSLTPYYFGGLPLSAVDGSGKPIKTWKFNISRYVQHVVNQTLPVYDLRVSSPFFVIDQYGIPGKMTDATVTIGVNPTIARGRVRLYGGSPVTNTRRMRLRIIYSKI